MNKRKKGLTKREKREGHKDRERERETYREAYPAKELRVRMKGRWSVMLVRALLVAMASVRP